MIRSVLCDSVYRAQDFYDNGRHNCVSVFTSSATLELVIEVLLQLDTPSLILQPQSPRNGACQLNPQNHRAFARTIINTQADAFDDTTYTVQNTLYNICRGCYDEYTMHFRIK